MRQGNHQLRFLVGCKLKHPADDICIVYKKVLRVVCLQHTVRRSFLGQAFSICSIVFVFVVDVYYQQFKSLRFSTFFRASIGIVSVLWLGSNPLH